ncbi:hypothetical protein PO909_012899 [Leuciscus waleckii]
MVGGSPVSASGLNDQDSTSARRSINSTLAPTSLIFTVAHQSTSSSGLLRPSSFDLVVRRPASPRDYTTLASPHPFVPLAPSGSSLPPAPPWSSVAPAPLQASGSPPAPRSPEPSASPCPSRSSASPWLIGSLSTPWSPLPLPPAPPPSVGPLESSALSPPRLLPPSVLPWAAYLAAVWIPTFPSCSKSFLCPPWLLPPLAPPWPPAQPAPPWSPELPAPPWSLHTLLTLWIKTPGRLRGSAVTCQCLFGLSVCVLIGSCFPLFFSDHSFVSMVTVIISSVVSPV